MMFKFTTIYLRRLVGRDALVLSFTFKNNYSDINSSLSRLSYEVTGG